MPFCGSPKVAYQRPGLHSGLCEYSECDGRVQKGKSAYRPVPMLNLMPWGGGSHADCKEGRNERIERTRQTVVTNGLDQDCFGSAANQAPPVCQVWSRRPNRCAVRR
jgi:hypothetical protein